MFHTHRIGPTPPRRSPCTLHRPPVRHGPDGWPEQPPPSRRSSPGYRYRRDPPRRPAPPSTPPPPAGHAHRRGALLDHAGADHRPGHGRRHDRRHHRPAGRRHLPAVRPAAVDRRGLGRQRIHRPLEGRSLRPPGDLRRHAGHRLELHDSANNIWQATVGDRHRHPAAVRRRCPRHPCPHHRQPRRPDPDQHGDTPSTTARSELPRQPDRPEPDRGRGRRLVHRPLRPGPEISGNTITMEQPAWDNNTFGLRHAHPPDQAGSCTWTTLEFLDTRGGVVPRPRHRHALLQAPARAEHGERRRRTPALESLLDVGGTYAAPAHNLPSHGHPVLHTSWLGPTAARATPASRPAPTSPAPGPVPRTP